MSPRNRSLESLAIYTLGSIVAAGLVSCSGKQSTNGEAGANASGSGGAAGVAAGMGSGGTGGASGAGGTGAVSVASGTGGVSGVGGTGGAGGMGGTGGMGGMGGAGGDPDEPQFSAYPKAPYEMTSEAFTLQVNDTPVDVVKLYDLYSYGHLAYNGTATFTVALKSGAEITSFDISPHSYGLNATATKDGSTLTFSRAQADSTYLIIKIKAGSETLENLVIAADPPEIDAPTIGGDVKDITAAPYDADDTGASLMTGTIQRAIDDVSDGGGGTVYFPAGVYQFSNIVMKSNVTVYLADGAVLRGSSNRDDYIWGEGERPGGQQSIVIWGNVTNVAFKGRGTIDASSTSLVSASSGGNIDGFGGFRKGIIGSKQVGSDRPDGITVEGITLRDSTTWTFDLRDALNVTIQNVKLLNDYNWVHADGFDICSVTNALVDNCLGVTGDDVFDAKVTSANPLENVTYSNNVAYARKGTGTKIGMQARGNANDITFENMDIVAGIRGVSVSHDDGSGTWTNLHFTDIRTEEIVGSSTSGQFRTAPIVIWSADYGDGIGPVRGVTLLRCSFENTNGKMSFIQGHDSTNNVSDVSLENVTMDGVAITEDNYESKINVGDNVTNLTF